MNKAKVLKKCALMLIGRLTASLTCRAVTGKDYLSLVRNEMALDLVSK